MADVDMADDAILFECDFELTKANEGGQKFEKVSRFEMKGHLHSYDVEVVVDINTDLYPLKVHDRIKLVLASTLNLDGSPDSGEYNQNFGVKTLLDSYEYGMHGKVFRYEHHEGMRVSAYVSYGGLLMKLTSHQAVLRQIRLDERLYCLIKRYGAAGGE